MADAPSTTSPPFAAPSWPADAVERWPISRLSAYANNPREHSDEQVALIARSIREYGWTIPALVDENGLLIAGHGRLAAARLLGITEIPVMVARGWTDAQKRAYRIADNALPLQATWAPEPLRLELTDLKLAGFDLALTGFDPRSLVSFMIDPNHEAAEQTPDPPVNPVTRRGDLWVLGEHRLLCGDATSESDVAACLAGAKPHLMVTDPPYGVDYDPDWRNRADRANGKPYGDRAVGQVQNDDRVDWREAFALFGGDVVYAWHAGRRARQAQDAIEAAGFEIRSQIIWTKPRHVISRGDYHWQHEPCWYAVREGKTGHWSGDRSQTTRWDIDHQKSETGHGTQKPIACMRRPIENNSRPGEAVYDPFVGSGTTIVAAEMTKRRCYAMDIDLVYCDVAVERWAKFTGGTPILEATGQTFAEVQDARFDGQADAAGSFRDGYAAVRERMAAGGPGWTPGASDPKSKKARSGGRGRSHQASSPGSPKGA